jgi:carboxypeptidase family protein
MTLRHILYSSVAAIGIAALSGAALTASVNSTRAQDAAVTPAIDNDDIGGVVRAPNGQPEAGVWVIAETTDLPTKFARMVVTDDQGRYVIPDLPVANYQVWVRGYGLVDSPKLRAKPGQQLNMASVPAPNEAAAGHYYPAIYWYSMMKIPGQDQFGPKAQSGIPENLTQIDWLADEEHRLPGMPPAGPGSDAHDPSATRLLQSVHPEAEGREGRLPPLGQILKVPAGR